MNKATTSVRDQRKRDTLSLIHDIAKALVLENGLSTVKVEDIAQAAGVSRRTFFNYYPTKEDAVLGLQPPTLPEVAIKRFNASHDDIVTRTTRLAVEVIRTTTVPSSSANNRRQLRRRFPELIQRFERRTQSSEELIRPVVAASLQHDSREPSPEDDVILGLSAAIIRAAYLQDHDIRDETISNTIQQFKETITKRL